ncbi:MAG: RNA-binding protein [Thermoplasmata archaeon]|nr:DUF1610 domain-containing protein [Thermoplasmata archaeon]RLF46198.1 MAG: RNA-binding protein [Thermoplasmata archaeon]HDD57300.1 DUF1610 domain-containing protein [Thermoplasmatales archaeon]
MELTDTCISCGVRLVEEGSVTFPCPICSAPIGRCGKCREQSTPYTCKECGFTGP